MRSLWTFHTGHKTGFILANYCGGTVDACVFASYLEAGGAPIHELDGAFGFDGGDSSIDVFRNDVAPVNTKNTPQAGSGNCGCGA